MIDSLSNFYRDFGYSDEDIEFFVDLYEELGSALVDYMESTKFNQSYGTMETYRRLPLTIFEGTSARYDVSTLLSSHTNALALGLTGGLESRIEQWNEIVPVEDKFSLLVENGYFVELSAKRDIDNYEPDIISAVFFDAKGTELSKDIDYYFKDRKIVFLGSFAAPSTRNTRVIARDVFVDYNFPERTLGNRIHLPYRGVLSKPEYRDFLNVAAKIVVSGPRVDVMKEAFQSLSGWEGADVIDQIGATGVRKRLWRTGSPEYRYLCYLRPETELEEYDMIVHEDTIAAQDVGALSPHQFVVSVPADLASTVMRDESGDLVFREERFGIFRYFLDIAKPIDTDYVFALTDTPTDPAPISDSALNNLDVNPVDSESVFDERVIMPSKTLTESYAINEVFDYREKTFPELPVSFSAAYHVSGLVRYEFVDNADGVDHYEVFRQPVNPETMSKLFENDILNPETLIHSMYTEGDTIIKALSTGVYMGGTYWLGSRDTSFPSGSTVLRHLTTGVMVEEGNWFSSAGRSAPEGIPDILDSLEFETWLDDLVWIDDDYATVVAEVPADGSASEQVKSGYDPEYPSLHPGVFEYYAKSIHVASDGLEISSRPSIKRAVSR